VNGQFYFVNGIFWVEILECCLSSIVVVWIITFYEEGE